MRPSHFVCVRPPECSAGLIYHPHFRPLTSPIAALLDLSASIHSHAPQGVPTPATILQSLASSFSNQRSSPLISSSPLDSVVQALTIPPIHVDHVAEAICIAVDNTRPDVRGVVGVKEMRELIGWSLKGSSNSAPPQSSSLHGHQHHTS